jgi:hypothetical protein
LGFWYYSDEHDEERVIAAAKQLKMLTVGEFIESKDWRKNSYYDERWEEVDTLLLAKGPGTGFYKVLRDLHAQVGY